MTTTVKIIGTGVEMEIDPELVDSKNKYETLRRALSVVAQGMQNAKITEKKEGENLIVEVQPKLAGKGSAADDHLRKCLETRNPAIKLFLDLNASRVKLGSHEMYNMGLQANAAVKKGEEWIEKIEKAEEILIKCKPAAVSIILPG
jgi:hypothetical protein